MVGTMHERGLRPARVMLGLWMILACPTASAQSEVGGTIDVDTTWTVAGSPYVVIAPIAVLADSTLTIQPGVVVQGQGHRLRVDGALDAVGREDQVVTFRNLRLSAVGETTIAHVDFERGELQSGGGRMTIESSRLSNLRTFHISGTSGVGFIENSRIENTTLAVNGGGAVVFRNNVVRATERIDHFVRFSSTAGDRLVSGNRFERCGAIFLGAGWGGFVELFRNVIVDSGGIVPERWNGELVLRNNLFLRPAGQAAITGDPHSVMAPKARRNSFLTAGRPVLYLPPGSPSGMDLSHNYWGTTDPAIIANLVWDGLDDPEIAWIADVSDPLERPHPNTPSARGRDASTVSTAGGTEVSGVIDVDATWTARGSPYRLSSDVRLAPEATLTLEPGVVIDGRSRALEVEGHLAALALQGAPIRVSDLQLDLAGGVAELRFFEATAGRLTALGGRLSVRDSRFTLASEVTLRGLTRVSAIETSVFESAGSVSVVTASQGASVALRRNRFIGATGAGAPTRFEFVVEGNPSVDLDISENRFERCGDFHLATEGNHAPSGDLRLHRNAFLDFGEIVVRRRAEGQVSILNNVLRGQRGRAAILSVESLRPPRIERNSFLSTDRLALRLNPAYSSFVDAPRNYWNTADRAVIQGMIWDGRDIPQIAHDVNVSPILVSPHASTPAPARSAERPY